MTILLFLGFGGLALFGLTADFIGIGNPNTFGISQILAVLAGSIGFLSTFLMRVKKWTAKDLVSGMGSSYSAIAVNLLNLVILICLVELGFTFAVKIYLKTQMQGALRDSLSSPAYENRSWFKTFHREYGDSQRFKYSPFVVWERNEMTGETVNILADGNRKTIDGDCKDGKKVYMFGGSTMWGVGSPDWNTIPSELQKIAKAQSAKKVCIRNFGENAYVSTQNLIKLEKLIQAGDIPDLVIFYNGFNEIAAGYQTRKPGMHQNYSDIEEKLNTGSNMRARRELGPKDLLQYFMPNTFNYLFVYGRHKAYDQVEFPKNLSHEIANTTLRDLEMVRALGKQYGFQTYSFLQPYLFYKNSPTEFEKDVSKEVSDNFRDLLKETYIDLRKAYGSSPHKLMFDISQVFLNSQGEIFIDKVHLVPEANETVANEMWKTLVRLKAI